MRARKKGKLETGKEGGSWGLGRGYGGGEPDKGYQCLSTLFQRGFLFLLICLSEIPLTELKEGADGCFILVKQGQNHKVTKKEGKITISLQSWGRNTNSPLFFFYEGMVLCEFSSYTLAFVLDLFSGKIK